jgi:hypothetical protein
MYCAAGTTAQIRVISRYVEPLRSSKSHIFLLVFPPCSLRLPKSDRLLGKFIFEVVDIRAAGGKRCVMDKNTVQRQIRVDSLDHDFS